MTSKQRSYLKGLAMTIDPILSDREKQPHPREYQGNRGGSGGKGADQDQRPAELPG